MSDKLKPPQKAPFHGIEVINGQEVIIPSHNRVSSTGEKPLLAFNPKQEISFPENQDE